MSISPSRPSLKSARRRVESDWPQETFSFLWRSCRTRSSPNRPRIHPFECDDMAVDHQDPEQRIAELERRLAEQQRINELQQRLADAQAASGQPRSVNPPMQSGGPFPEADQ